MLKKRKSTRKAYQLDNVLNQQTVVQKDYLLIDRMSPKYQEYSPYICVWYDRIDEHFMNLVIASKRKVFCATEEIKAKLDEFELDSDFEKQIKLAEWAKKVLTKAKSKAATDPKTKNTQENTGKTADELGI